VTAPPFLIDGPLTRQDLAEYYHEISRLDRFIGRVRKELDRQEIAQNTYIIFCADNGRPFPRCKTRLYDSGAKTPLIVWRPGAVQPARTASLVSVIDVTATVLELAGVDVDQRVQGVSFSPILADPDATVRDYAFSEHNWHVGAAHERSVRWGDWLYIRNSFPELQSLSVESGPQYPAGKELWDAHAARRLSAIQQDVFLKPRPAEELYDVRSDPHQLQNLAGNAQHVEVQARLSGVLDRWIDETGDSIQKNVTPGASVVGRRQGMNPDFQRGDMPGADHNAAEINAPGPIRQRPAD
jgi:arylsulfatase